MVMSEPKPDPTRRQRVSLYLYIVVFIAITCVTTVFLSLNGFISLSPLTALVAGFIAGVAFVMFQLTYMRFVVNSSRRMHRKDPDIL
jgi:uncharacterized membrane protein